MCNAQPHLHKRPHQAGQLCRSARTLLVLRRLSVAAPVVRVSQLIRSSLDCRSPSYDRNDRRRERRASPRQDKPLHLRMQSTRLMHQLGGAACIARAKCLRQTSPWLTLSDSMWPGAHQARPSGQAISSRTTPVRCEPCQAKPPRCKAALQLLCLEAHREHCTFRRRRDSFSPDDRDRRRRSRSPEERDRRSRGEGRELSPASAGSPERRRSPTPANRDERMDER